MARNCTHFSGEGPEAEHLQHPGKTGQRLRSCSTKSSSLCSSRRILAWLLHFGLLEMPVSHPAILVSCTPTVTPIY